MTYSEVMTTSILIMFGTVFFMIFMAFLISKRRNRNTTPVYATSYDKPQETTPQRTESGSDSSSYRNEYVRYKTSVSAEKQEYDKNARRVIKSDRNMKAVRECSYSDPRFRSVRSPRFSVLNTTMLQ